MSKAWPTSRTLTVAITSRPGRMATAEVNAAVSGLLAAGAARSRDPFAAACCNQNHTQNSRSIDYYKLNGWPIGEIAQFALCTGALGVPLIFLSGEEAAYREAEELVPEIVIASVKVGLARSSVISLSALMARALIKERIQEAVAKYLAEPWSPLV